MKNGIDYNKDHNKSYYYHKGYVIASLNHSTNEFETEIEMTEKEAEDIYNEMICYFSSLDDYDVRSEQGLYGYGY